MLHPFISTLIRRPNLLVDHLAAYAELVQQEASEAGTELLGRILAWAMVVVCAIVFLILTGVALMLGAVLTQFHWVLVAVPAVVLALLLVAVLIARKPLQQNNFAEVKAQVDRDVQALRSAA